MTCQQTADWKGFNQAEFNTYFDSKKPGYFPLECPIGLYVGKYKVVYETVQYRCVYVHRPAIWRTVWKIGNPYGNARCIWLNCVYSACCEYLYVLYDVCGLTIIYLVLCGHSDSQAGCLCVIRFYAEKIQYYKHHSTSNRSSSYLNSDGFEDVFHLNAKRNIYLWKTHIEGILPKGPYPPCLRMADRAFLAGYPRYSSDNYISIECNYSSMP